MTDDARLSPRLLSRPLTRLAVSPAARAAMSPARRLDPAVLGLPIAQPRPVPQPTPRPAPAPAPGPTVPLAPAGPDEGVGTTVFDALPFPQPGDRIRSEDFRTLSQALATVADAYALSSALLGRTFAEARLFLTSQQYVIERVVTVFGNETAATDPSLDGRVVLSVAPVQLGDRGVAVIVSEAVDTRRVTPDLGGLTYAAATERVRAVVGDAPAGTGPVPAPNLVGLPLDGAASSVVQR